jgi:phytoene dehydrogenase-like protein
MGEFPSVTANEIAPIVTGMHDSDIVIVGAGITGLRAALELTKAGLSVLVVEQNETVGGRMRTSLIQGCKIDHGFQVLLTSYPELKTLPSLRDLNCRPFTYGARVRIDYTWSDLVDPRRHPGHFLRAIKSPLGSIADLIRFGLCVYGHAYRSPSLSDISTASMIDSCRFSRRFSDGFLKPFLRGVLLDPALHTDSALARFYLRTFAQGGAALPAGGIQAFPELLAATLGREHLLLGTKICGLAKNRVTLENGEDISAKHIICASDALSAAALGGPEQTSPHCGTKTIYFLAERPPYPEPIIVLDGDSTGPINNLSVPSNVQPSYAPAGQALISASIVGAAQQYPEADLVTAARRQLHSWFGSQVAKWEHITTITIPNALPARPRMASGWIQKDGVLFAGDYLTYGSQNGALMAGRQVAQAVINGFNGNADIVIL